jgi:hypothetical protein
MSSLDFIISLDLLDLGQLDNLFFIFLFDGGLQTKSRIDMVVVDPRDDLE